ncbi:MAG: 30S ribosomal protein S3 [Candidatus Woykebacteria bacterium]
MGQKVHPKAFRLAKDFGWSSLWFAERKRYKEFLEQDVKIRSYIMARLKAAGVSHVVIERSINKLNIIIYVARPGMVIGRSGAGVEDLRKSIDELVGQKVSLNIEEIRVPDLDAYLVARSVADQIERRLPVKKIMATSVSRVMRSGAAGVKILCSGRIGGREIARKEKLVEGSIPLATLRADIDFAVVPARTATAGVVGVKVWIYKKPPKTKD